MLFGQRYGLQSHRRHHLKVWLRRSVNLDQSGSLLICLLMFDRSDMHLRRLSVHAKSGGFCPLQRIFDLALKGFI